MCRTGCLRNQHKYVESIALTEKTYALRKKHIGASHPTTQVRSVCVRDCVFVCVAALLFSAFEENATQLCIFAACACINSAGSAQQ
jgi:hypothetical protein